MTVTINDVTEGFKIFKDITDNQATRAINRAQRKATKDGLTSDDLDDGIIDYARHLLFIEQAMSYGPVASAETLGNSQTNLDKLKDNDSFLIAYNDLVESSGNSDDWAEVWSE